MLGLALAAIVPSAALAEKTASSPDAKPNVEKAQVIPSGPPPLPKVAPPPLPTKQPGPPPLPKAQFWAAIDGQQKGPLTLADIKRMIQEKRITKDTLVWKEGTKTWVEAQKIPEIAKLFPKGPPPISDKLRIKRFLVGHWTGETQLTLGGVTESVLIDVTYHEDGTLSGTQTHTSPSPMEGIPPSNVVVVVEGTWEVKAASKDTFTLVEKVKGYMPGMPAISETHTSRWEIVDNDTIRNLEKGYELHRAY
ncbi:MAG: DUF4339 domain-containing protein [Gammaproteobacteria bacterium]|nr:MAG: DUF4339 domain-containing protein [Gammaproteobacteria bacterium]